MTSLPFRYPWVWGSLLKSASFTTTINDLSRVVFLFSSILCYLQSSLVKSWQEQSPEYGIQSALCTCSWNLGLFLIMRTMELLGRTWNFCAGIIRVFYLFLQAKTKGIESGMDIGVKYSEKQERAFNDEKLKAGHCVIGLQVSLVTLWLLILKPWEI